MSFATVVDYWGLADTNHILQSSSRSATVGGNAQAMDENGDVQCETGWGDAYEFSSTYKLINGATETGSGILLGAQTNGDTNGDTRAKTSLQITTSNSDFPEIVVSGRTVVGYDSGATTWTPAGISVVGSKMAQGIGVAAGASSYITGSSVTASLSIEAVVYGDSGDLVKVAFGGGRQEASAELSACSATPTATADTEWTLVQNVSANSENTAYQTGTINVFRNVAGA